MKHYFFCIDEKPYCLFDNGYQDINADYIKQIDSRFYDFVAEQNIHIINNEETEKAERQFAAISLRNYYTQALETLFALIFATLQAPACIPGWMLKYRNNDLYKLVEKTNNCTPIKLRFTKIHNISWKSISKLIFHYFDGKEKEAKQSIINNFTKLLSSFANDFLDKTLQNEYNSIKHGFRTKVGGSTLALKEVNKNGIPKHKSDWVKIFGSEYGSSFYIDENLLNSKNHFRLKHHSNSWNPENLFHGIHFASLLIENLITFLKAFNKIEAAMLQYKSVSPEHAFNLPWDKVIGTGNITMDLGFDYNATKIFSKEEILTVYDTPSE